MLVTGSGMNRDFHFDFHKYPQGVIVEVNRRLVENLGRKELSTTTIHYSH